MYNKWYACSAGCFSIKTQETLSFLYLISPLQTTKHLQPNNTVSDSLITFHFYTWNCKKVRLLQHPFIPSSSSVLFTSFKMKILRLNFAIPSARFGQIFFFFQKTNNREYTNLSYFCCVYLNTNMWVWYTCIRYVVLVTPVGQEISQISHGKSPSHSLGQFHEFSEEVMQTNETYNNKKWIQS